MQRKRFVKPAYCLAGLTLIFSAVTAAETDVADQYQATANQLIDAALADSEGYSKLAYLCDQIGNRLSGSAGLERAIAWAADQMKRDGLSNVRLLPVKVPHWVRGTESGAILTPVERPL